MIIEEVVEEITVDEWEDPREDGSVTFSIVKDSTGEYWLDVDGEEFDIDDFGANILQRLAKRIWG